MWGLSTLAFANAGLMGVGYIMANYQPNYVTIPLVGSILVVGVVGAIISFINTIEESF